MKACTRCAQSKPLGEFYFRTGGRSGERRHDSQCKSCVKAQMQTYRDANRDKVRQQQRDYLDRNRELHRERQFIRSYGITWADRDQMLAEQGGRCAICRTDDPGGRGGWHMDHDHSCCPAKATSCGRCLRGLLCSNCNLMLGNGKDSIATLLAAIEYLTVSRMRPVA